MGDIIANCASLNEAIAAANSEAKSCLKISVYDVCGKELYAVIPKQTGETENPKNTNKDQSVDKPTEQSKEGKFIIALMPQFKERPPEQS